MVSSERLPPPKTLRHAPPLRGFRPRGDHSMTRSFVLSAVCSACLFAGTSALAAGKPAAKPAAKPVPQSTAAADSAASETISPAQLEIATRVMQGEAQCEFNQKVGVHA